MLFIAILLFSSLSVPLSPSVSLAPSTSSPSLSLSLIQYHVWLALEALRHCCFAFSLPASTLPQHFSHNIQLASRKFTGCCCIESVRYCVFVVCWPSDSASSQLLSDLTIFSSLWLDAKRKQRMFLWVYEHFCNARVLSASQARRVCSQSTGLPPVCPSGNSSISTRKHLAMALHGDNDMNRKTGAVKALPIFDESLLPLNQLRLLLYETYLGRERMLRCCTDLSIISKSPIPKMNCESV